MDEKRLFVVVMVAFYKTKVQDTQEPKSMSTTILEKVKNGEFRKDFKR